MFNTAKRKEKQKLSIAIDQLLTEMITIDIDSPEHAIMLERCERVNKLRRTQSPMTSIDSADVLKCATTLLGIGIIVGYEQKHVWTSAAAKFLKLTY